MQRLLNIIQKEDSWKECLRKSCRRNVFKTSLASLLTPLKFKPLYERLLKTYQSNQEKAKNCWFQNELKAYHWMLIVVSWVQDVPIDEFNQKQWNILQQMFYCKELHVLEYEALRLNNKKQVKNRSWNKEQQEILKQVIRQKDLSNKWNDVARTLFKKSDRKYYRTGKQCRERWYNHLDPQKIHGNWTVQEDVLIADFILKNGKKWSQIARRMGRSRTQHMVKNRFKSILIQHRKDQPKLKQSQILNKVIINSTILSQINDYQQNESQQISQELSEDQLSSENYHEMKRKENLKQESIVLQKNNEQEQKKIVSECKETLQRSVSYQQKDSQNIFHQNKQDANTKAKQIVDQNNILSPSPMEVQENQQGERIPKQTQNQSELNNMFELKMFSPFCGIYTPLNPPTPLYKTPSPSMPFFMSSLSSFAQCCIHFSNQLNQTEIKNVQSNNDN